MHSRRKIYKGHPYLINMNFSYFINMNLITNYFIKCVYLCLRTFLVYTGMYINMHDIDKKNKNGCYHICCIALF